MIRKPFRLIILVFLVVILLAACSPGSPSLTANNPLIINNGSSFGQTFTARNDGLSGVSVLLGPSPYPSTGSLLFHLRTDLQSEDNIANARLPLSDVDRQEYYKFDFPPISNSEGKDFFLDVEVEGDGGAQIFTGEADSYLDGGLYINQSPQEAQLGFRLDYDNKYYLLGLSKLSVQWIGVLSIGVFAFVLPGWALFSLLWHSWNKLNWCSKLGLSGGLGLAIYPLLMLWSNLIGLNLGFLYAFLPPVAGLIALIWKNQKLLRNIPTNLIQKNTIFNRHNLPSVQVILADISFVIVFGLIIASRFWVIRSLDVPLFGDSYQHTMISQLIIDHGGLFNSWEPYADLVTFTYHFGFHSSVAVFHWISGLSVEKSMLWMGQIINILAILGLYPLAFKITNNRWAGVIAMLIGGLLSPMPMYYVNWGRYTQLAGQAVLPTVIWCAWSILERPYPDLTNIPFIRKLTSWHNLSLDYGSLSIMWLSLGGLALTHYRVLILAILFFPAYEIFHYSRKEFIAWIGRVAWIGLGGMLLFLPWFIHVFGGKIMAFFIFRITTLPSAISTATAALNSIGNLQTYVPIFIWILLFLSIGLGIWKRNKDIMIFTVWWLLIILSTNPDWIGLPGTGLITNFAIFIAFYIPASVIAGSAVQWLSLLNQQLDKSNNSSSINKINRYVFPGLVLLFVFVLGLWGYTQRIKDIDIPTYALITRPDLRAMAWIKTNTAPEARFLINSFSAYGDTSIVGSDAGWWLPILAHRQSTVPPLTYAAEQGITADYGQKVKGFFDKMKVNGITSPEALGLLKEHGISHIYIGQRHGNVNYSGTDVLDPLILNNDQHFHLVYHEDRVWIFEIKY